MVVLMYGFVSLVALPRIVQVRLVKVAGARFILRQDEICESPNVIRTRAKR
jgi:hypothetical protein